jgi:hypothetical protein
MHRALVTLLLGLAATTADAEPMFRADQSHSGVYNAAGVPVLHGVKWKFRAKGPIISTPRSRRARVLRQQRPQRLRP